MKCFAIVILATKEKQSIKGLFNGSTKKLEIFISLLSPCCSRLPLSVFTVIHWQVTAGLKLLYHPPLGAMSCITAMSVADQYNAGEFESAPESSLILSIKFVWRPDVETVRWKPRNEQVKCLCTSPIELSMLKININKKYIFGSHSFRFVVDDISFFFLNNKLVFMVLLVPVYVTLTSFMGREAWI